jgi:hypothetical protein
MSVFCTARREFSSIHIHSGGPKSQRFKAGLWTGWA